MNKSVVIYSKNVDNILEILPDGVGVYIVDDEESAKDMLNLNQKFKIFIMDSKTILESDSNIFKNIKTDKIFRDLPIIAYSDSDAYVEKNSLYSLGINGIVNDESTKEVVLSLINRIALKSNPDIGSKKDRFIKSLILYEGFEDSVGDAIYLADYLISDYKLTSEELDIIKDSVSLLIIAYKKNNFNEIIKLLDNMEISPSLKEKMLNFHKLESLVDNIIFLALLFNSNELSVDVKTLVDFDKLDEDVYNLAKEASEYKKIYIDNYTDINRFWNILNTTMLEDNEFSLEESDDFLKHVLSILNTALIKKGGLEAHLETNHKDYLLVNLKPYNCNLKYAMKCMDNELFSYPNIEVSYENETDDSGVSVVIRLDAEPLKKPEVTVIDTIDEIIPDLTQVSKVDAKAYCEDIDIDTDLLDDLEDISEVSLDTIEATDGITDEVLNVTINALEKYIRLFNQSIEFEHVSDGFTLLKSALETCNTENIDSTLQISINGFLSGVIHDVKEWKNHIYILQDAPDIHYMDDSMISNCVAIAGMLNPVDVEDDDDDLEFF